MRVTPQCEIQPGLAASVPAQLSENRDLLTPGSEQPRYVEIPVEHYLRDLWDLDLNDARAIDEFVNEWGMPDEVQGPVSVESVRLRFIEVRNMTRCWDVLSDGSNLDELAEQWEGSEGVPATEDECATYLERLNAALKDHTPLISMREEPVYKTTLYAVLCAQLFNHIAEGRGYLRCADPKCARLFVRHLNRKGQPGPDKKTVRFCSQQCQDRYFNEEYRRRQRVAALRATGLDAYQIAKKMGVAEDEVLRWMQALDDGE